MPKETEQWLAGEVILGCPESNMYLDMWEYGELPNPEMESKGEREVARLNLKSTRSR